MIVQIAFFTEQGRKTAYQIENRIENQAGNQIENQMEADFVCDFYDKSKCTLSEWTQKAFSSKSALIFVGAAGIAVRTIAVFLIPFAKAVSARVSTVQINAFSSSQVALYTSAAGVSFLYPPSISL